MKLKTGISVGVQGLLRDVLCSNSCVPSISSPLSSQYHSLPSLVHSHSPRNYSHQMKSFNVPLVALLWVEEWWSRRKLTGCKTLGVFFVHILIYLIFCPLSRMDGNVFCLWKLWGHTWLFLQSVRTTNLVQFHWKKNLLLNGPPVQVRHGPLDMKIQLSPQYWKVHCIQRAHLLLMGSRPWSKHRTWLPGDTVISEAAQRFDLAWSWSGTVSHSSLLKVTSANT